MMKVGRGRRTMGGTNKKKKKNYYFLKSKQNKTHTHVFLEINRGKRVLQTHS
jgi:hypothetical protein